MTRSLVLKLLCAASLAVAAPMPAAAQSAPRAAEPSLADRIINTPRPDALHIGGVNPKPRVRDEAGVQGGKALRITTPADAPNAWTVLASSRITKPVTAGDELVLAFWARLIESETGDDSIILPSNAIRRSAAPYGAVINGRVELGREWALHEVRGVADRDYAAGELLGVLHLSSGQHTLELGPVFVFNFGAE
ncbi:hypothetical protein [Brevundimonas bullata]|uniref:hypothetical protein n=1 Tax=Brevundimonas bullata TaxID=13160 RepID=UPI002FDAD978